jgi:hypothetical protein
MLSQRVTRVTSLVTRLVANSVMYFSNCVSRVPLEIVPAASAYCSVTENARRSYTVISDI